MQQCLVTPPSSFLCPTIGYPDKSDSTKRLCCFLRMQIIRVSLVWDQGCRAGFHKHKWQMGTDLANWLGEPIGVLSGSGPTSPSSFFSSSAAALLSLWQGRQRLLGEAQGYIAVLVSYCEPLSPVSLQSLNSSLSTLFQKVMSPF